MGVMAAVGYMAAETGSETQGGGRCKAGGWGRAHDCCGRGEGRALGGGGLWEGPGPREEWGGASLSGGGVATAGDRPEGVARATEDPSGWGRSLTSRATAEGGALAGHKRRNQMLQGAGPRPETGPGPEEGGVARCERESRMRGRPPRGGAVGGA